MGKKVVVWSGNNSHFANFLSFAKRSQSNDYQSDSGLKTESCESVNLIEKLDKKKGDSDEDLIS